MLRNAGARATVADLQSALDAELKKRRRMSIMQLKKRKYQSH